MTRMKKLASLLLAMVMAFALAAPALAAPEEETPKVPEVPAKTTATITRPATAEDETAHNYAIYQIFKGTPDGDSLTDVTWGDSLSSTSGFIQSLKDQEALKDKKQIIDLKPDSSAAEVAQAIYEVSGGKAGDKGPEAQAVQEAAKLNLKPTAVGRFDGTNPNDQTVDLPYGYYLISDTDPDTGDTSYTLNRLVGDITIRAKSETEPEVEKQVREFNIDGNGNWAHDVSYPTDPDTGGQKVDFQLTATMPQNFSTASKEPYALSFHDEQDDTLTFDPTSLKVTIGGVDITDQVDLVENPSDNCTFEVVIDDVRHLTGVTVSASSKIVVTYTSTLNANAVMGGTGNKNTVTLKYGPDGKPSTPSTVTVFTFQVNLTKVDGVDPTQKLTGAEFKLERLDHGTGTQESDWTPVEGYTGTEAAADTFVFSKLAAGRYRLTETKAPTEPKQYNTIPPIYFEIVPTYGTDTTGKKIVTELVAVEKNADWSDLTGNATLSFTGTTDTGLLESNVPNFAGVVLPETGGIGTTIFYIVGGVLVVGAAVLLITKRRMGVDEE